MKNLRFLCLAAALTLVTGCSSGINPVNTRADPPTGVTATAGTAQVVLSWTASLGAATYNVYFSNTSGVTTGSPGRITGISATTYTQAPLTSGIPYYYIVTAVNTDGEGLPSAQVSAKPN